MGALSEMVLLAVPGQVARVGELDVTRVRILRLSFRIRSSSWTGRIFSLTLPLTPTVNDLRASVIRDPRR